MTRGRTNVPSITSPIPIAACSKIARKRTSLSRSAASACVRSLAVRSYQEKDYDQTLRLMQDAERYGSLDRAGRKVCKARTPLCGECILVKLCPSAFVAGA